ncbi:MAG: hypothetical protein ABJN34_02495 [Litoreibacter sp.]|uniref:hypothetical protein n=1 Tax=Litoreibacter sp. TaxID=1969459 RepID=UPI003299C32F
MDEISEIVDFDSLKAWLEARPKEDAVVIAHRAAQRVLPIVWQDFTRRGELTPLPFLRCNLTSGEVCYAGSPEVKAAANAANAAAKAAAADAAAANAAAYAAFSAANAAANAAYASANAANAAYAAAAYAADAAAVLWNNVRQDAASLTAGQNLSTIPLWADDDNPLQKLWVDLVPELRAQFTGSEQSARAEEGIDYSFWIDWYERALKGTETRWEMIAKIALIADDVWQGDPSVLMDKINAIWQRKTDQGTPTSQAAVVDFSFDAQLRLMKASGFDDDAAHLRDPAKVQSFLDDIEEMRDAFQDFSDFAAEKSTQTNAPRVLSMGADKLLKEFQRCKDLDHLRARRILTLGKQVQGLLGEEANRKELGETLSEMLETDLEALNDVCRKHFLPSVARLEPLDDLDMGDVQPADLLVRFEKALETVEHADGDNLQPLAPEDLTLLRDMLSELRDTGASLAEARSDEYRETTRKRFARRAGALGSTIGRYVQKGSEVANDAGKKFDDTVKQYKRYETIQGLLDWLQTFISGGGG